MMCICGHSINEHLGGGARQCMNSDCDCDGFDGDVEKEPHDPRGDNWNYNGGW